MRVVSTTCSNTEIVCALGRGDCLVGVDDHSDYPPAVVASLPRVGPDLTVDIDKIAALKPDLVLASLTVPGHEKVIAGLREAGLRYLAPEPVGLDDVYDDIRAIAAALGVEERAESLIATMRGGIKPVSSRRPASVLVQWWPKPVIAPGKHSWVTDLLQAAGLRNPLAEREVKSAPLHEREVARLDPDAIVIAWCGVKPEKYRPKVVLDNPAFAALSAVRARRVYCIPEAWLGRPGPRLVEGYRTLRKLAVDLSTSR